MISVDLRALIEQAERPLPPTRSKAAAGLCLSRRRTTRSRSSTGCSSSLEQADTDVGAAPAPLRGRSRRASTQSSIAALDRFKTGNARTPALSPRIPKLIREAWVLASLAVRAPQVRSGMLLLALLADEDARAPARTRPRRELAKLSTADALRKDLLDDRRRLVERGRRTPAADGAGGAAAREPGAPARRRQDAGARPVHDRPHRDGAKAGEIDPGPRPRLRDPPGDRHPDAPPAEQPDPHRRGGRRQDGGRRGLRAAHRRGRRAAVAPERRRPHARPRPAAGRRRREGRVREPAQVGHRRGQGVAEADHPVHRRGAHA